MIKTSDLDRELSLLKQELKFRKSEIEKLKEQLEGEKTQKLKLELKVESLRDQLENSKKVDDKEIVVSKMTYMGMEQTIHQNLEKIRELEKEVNDHKIERQISINKSETLEKAVDEQKKMYENMIDNLNERLKKDEINQNQIAQLKNMNENETKDKFKHYEAQIAKLKNFKLVLKYATTMQCANCNRFISTAMFVDHLKMCLPPHQNPFLYNYSSTNSEQGILEEEEEVLQNNIMN